MNLNTAIKAIYKYGPIRHTSFKWYKLIRQMIVDNHAVVLSSEWLNSNRQYNWVSEPDISNETSYDGCFNITITSDGVKLLLDVTVWDGDLYDGARIQQRCKFSIEITNMVDDIERDVIQLLRNTASDLFEDEERKRRENRERVLFADLMNEVAST
jgi:hypothetical protein